MPLVFVCLKAANQKDGLLTSRVVLGDGKKKQKQIRSLDHFSRLICVFNLVQTALALNWALTPKQGARLWGRISGVTLLGMDGSRSAARSPLIDHLREINNCKFVFCICTVCRSTTSIGQSVFPIKPFTYLQTLTSGIISRFEKWAESQGSAGATQLSQGKGRGRDTLDKSPVHTAT